jgi:hypothetical protein
MTAAQDGETPMRVLVTGSRHATDEDRRFLWNTLHDIAMGAQSQQPPRSLVIVHGQCPYGGIDKYADEWAQLCPHATPEPHPAEGHGAWPACGPRRNSHMVQLGAELCVAIPGPNSKGTWDCLRKAVEAGIPALVTRTAEI